MRICCRRAAIERVRKNTARVRSCASTTLVAAPRAANRFENGRAIVSAEFDINDLKRRMQGAIQSLQPRTRRLADRARQRGPRRARAGAGLRPDHAAEPGRHDQRAGARTLSVQVWDKGMVSAVEKAIRDANLGLSPVVEGQILRIRIPELNEQRRKEMVKVAHKYGEEGAVAVRHVRRDGIDQAEEAAEGQDASPRTTRSASKPRCRR